LEEAVDLKEAVATLVVDQVALVALVAPVAPVDLVAPVDHLPWKVSSVALEALVALGVVQAAQVFHPWASGEDVAWGR
jgi:hypothetical protein